MLLMELMLIWSKKESLIQLKLWEQPLSTQEVLPAWCLPLNVWFLMSLKKKRNDIDDFISDKKDIRNIIEF